MKGKIEKRYWIPGLIMLLWMGIFAFANGSCQSFWADELASIGFIRDGLSLPEVMDTYLRVENNLPLYPLILYVVYRVMPYGERFLLIPSILFCLVGIVILAGAARRLKGKRAGFIALCMGTSSGILIWQAAWEIRCYALAFLLSAFVLYAYIGKSIQPDKKRLILWGTAVALFLWTHWFACILLAFYGIVDLMRVLFRKMSWKQLLCYVPGCVLYLPWLILSFYYKHGGLEDYWSEVPQWKDMPWTVLFYLDGNLVLWYLCLLTGAGCLAYAFFQWKKPCSEKRTKAMLAAFCVTAIGWMIGLIYVFSKYIAPQSGLFVERYFTVVQPHILLVTTLGLDCILDFAGKLWRPERGKCGRIAGAAAWLVRMTVVVLLAVSFVTCYRNEYISIRKPFEQYREAADALVADGGIWKKKSLFTGSNQFCMLDGFVHYYFEKRGYKPPSNIVDSMVHSGQETRFYSNYKALSKKELLSYDRIYCLRIHMNIDDAFLQFLTKHYQRIQDRMKNGIEIWVRKTGYGQSP